MRIHLFMLGLLVLIGSCKDSVFQQDKQAGVILIQPFEDMPEKETISLYKALQKNHPNVKLLKAIPLPQTAYYSPRNRFRADSLIRFLRDRTSEGCVSIGLTSKDISHDKASISDYGIMGLGYQPGRSCIVSTFRLSKTNLSKQFLKLSLHELGHTQGLPHCPEKTCLMRDAEGKNHFEEQIGFCKDCKEYLQSRGWRLD